MKPWIPTSGWLWPINLNQCKYLHRHTGCWKIFLIKWSWLEENVWLRSIVCGSGTNLSFEDIEQKRGALFIFSLFLSWLLIDVWGEAGDHCLWSGSMTPYHELSQAWPHWLRFQMIVTTSESEAGVECDSVWSPAMLWCSPPIIQEFSYSQTPDTRGAHTHHTHHTHESELSLDIWITKYKEQKFRIRQRQMKENYLFLQPPVNHLWIICVVMSCRLP